MRSRWVAFVLASLSTSACHLAGGSCNCPALGSGAVVLPAARSSAVVSVMTGSSCSASDGGSGQINVSRSTPGTCGVTVELMNGDTYAFDVEFEEFDPGGCCAGVRAGPVSTPTILDGGVDGRG